MKARLVWALTVAGALSGLAMAQSAPKQSGAALRQPRSSSERGGWRGWKSQGRTGRSLESPIGTARIPAAFTVFPGEIYQPSRRWAEGGYPNLTYFNEVDKGGHFAAWEEPQLFAREQRKPGGVRSRRRCDRRRLFRIGSHRRWRRRASGSPAGSRSQLDVFGVARTERLQPSILLFGEKRGSHGRGHLDSVAAGLVLLSRIQRRAVVAQAPAARRALSGAINEEVLARLLVVTHDVRLAAGPLQLAEAR